MLALTVVGAVSSAAAYSLLLKEYDIWQTGEIGYQIGADIGGPANQHRGEEYRWNLKTIYYGFDLSFLNYFGAQGTNAIAQAFGVLNAIPPASQISSNLAEYSLDTTRINYRASALGLFDLKSVTLAALLEQSGLAAPERWVWCLYAANGTNYTVIKRNYDPVTREISSYVNGVLYTYVIVDDVYADAVEIQVDPLQIGFTSVAGAIDRGLGVGTYFTGLTRDDIGGWKRLYESSSALIQNHFESLPVGTAGEAGSNPWLPFPGGTNIATNAISIVTNALRSGVNKVEFKTGQYDSYLGVFVVPITNKWDDTFRTNMYAPIQMQKVQRVVAQPDILLVADYLGTTADGFQLTFTRTDTANWVNNSTNNGVASRAGPGVISGPVRFTYNSIAPYFINVNPYLLDESRAFPGVAWGSFDGTTNDPIVYPVSWASLQQLQLQAIYGSVSPWTIPSSIAATNSGAVGNGAVDNTGAGGTGN